MLDGGADSLALHSVDIAEGDARWEVGVFAEVFEVASVERRAINIHTRTEHEMNAAGAGVVTDGGSDEGGHFRIPGCCQTDAAEYYCGWTVVADADWAVGHLQSRQTDLFVGANVEIILTADQVDLLFDRQLLEHGADAGIDIGGCGLR